MKNFAYSHLRKIEKFLFYTLFRNKEIRIFTSEKNRKILNSHYKINLQINLILHDLTRANLDKFVSFNLHFFYNLSLIKKWTLYVILMIYKMMVHVFVVSLI